MLLQILIFALLNGGKSAKWDAEEDLEDWRWNGLEERIQKVVDQAVKVKVEESMKEAREAFQGVEGKLMREKAELEDEVRRSSSEIATTLKVELEEEIARRCKVELMEQLENSITSNVKKGSTTYGVVCVYKYLWDAANSLVTYDRITSGLNSNGYGLTVDPESGSFTIITSGHYMITFSGHANVHPGQRNEMFLYHNEQRVEESRWVTMAEYSGSYIIDQGSRTLVS